MDKKIDNVSTHNIEGPVLVRTITLPISPYGKILNPQDPKNEKSAFDVNDEGKLNPFRKALVNKLEDTGDTLLSGALKDSAGNYIYRCFKGNHSSSEEVYRFLHDYGTNTDLSKDDKIWYEAGGGWFYLLWPENPQHKNIERGYVAIYKNDSNYFDTDKTELNIGERNSEKSTLRDNLLGVIEIKWQK